MFIYMHVVIDTAYEKTKGALNFALLKDLFLIKRGVDWTCTEINKALALSAITLMLFSFLPSVTHEGGQVFEVVCLECSHCQYRVCCILSWTFIIESSKTSRRHLTNFPCSHNADIRHSSCSA
jgi:hypothetical protein